MGIIVEFTFDKKEVKHFKKCLDSKKPIVKPDGSKWTTSDYLMLSATSAAIAMSAELLSRGIERKDQPEENLQAAVETTRNLFMTAFRKCLVLATRVVNDFQIDMVPEHQHFRALEEDGEGVIE